MPDASAAMWSASSVPSPSTALVRPSDDNRSALRVYGTLLTSPWRSQSRFWFEPVRVSLTMVAFFLLGGEYGNCGWQELSAGLVGYVVGEADSALEGSHQSRIVLPLRHVPLMRVVGAFRSCGARCSWARRCGSGGRPACGAGVSYDPASRGAGRSAGRAC